MKVDTMKVKLTGISPILGSISMDKEIYTNFIAAKAKSIEEKKSAEKMVENVEDVEEKITGFYRDPDTEEIILMGYEFKGFLKGAAKALKDQLKLGTPASKIDNYVFITEEYVPILVNGESTTKPDGYCERSLRCDTMQGPRTSLAKSEKIEKGWEATFTISVVANSGTAKSVKVDIPLVEELLDYGRLKGLLQWRNAGYGSFTWERVD